MDQKPTQISFAEIMQDGHNYNSFYIESQNAHRRMFGAEQGPYSVDSMAYFSVALECHKYASEHMMGKPRFGNRKDILSFALDQVAIEGLRLEFGVASGETINIIADKLPGQTVFGFDSFEGLPEAWVPGIGTGSFHQDALPSVRENVELVVGLFDRTLPAFLDLHPGPVAFLHIDCDLYYSTQTVLTQLRSRIVPGTVIQFDEYFNYPGWHLHEFLAFQQFVAYERLKYEYIALCPFYEPVTVKILG